jgi:hypothetical protein
MPDKDAGVPNRIVPWQMRNCTLHRGRGGVDADEARTLIEDRLLQLRQLSYPQLRDLEKERSEVVAESGVTYQIVTYVLEDDKNQGTYASAWRPTTAAGVRSPRWSATSSSPPTAPSSGSSRTRQTAQLY